MDLNVYDFITLHCKDCVINVEIVHMTAKAIGVRSDSIDFDGKEEIIWLPLSQIKFRDESPEVKKDGTKDFNADAPMWLLRNKKLI